jgi:hypothetical protein
VIWLEKGKIVRAGDDVPAIIDAYLAATGGEPLVRDGKGGRDGYLPAT